MLHFDPTWLFLLNSRDHPAIFCPSWFDRLHFHHTLSEGDVDPPRRQHEDSKQRCVTHRGSTDVLQGEGQWQEDQQLSLQSFPPRPGMSAKRQRLSPPELLLLPACRDDNGPVG